MPSTVLFAQRALALAGLALGLAGCADFGPLLTDRNTVYTPIFADNRVYYLKARDQAKQTQELEPLGVAINRGAGERPIERNSPLSIVLRSVEIPAKSAGDSSANETDSAITGAADYAVILDIGTKADGTSQSLVIWYQRGVQPDQSLNFSNLLVFYEPRWDERVAPYFRIRVMDVTTERNAETKRALERAHNLGNSLGALAANPAVSPLIGIAFTAAELVLANKQNRMVLDYSVQLYSSRAATQAGSSELGVLKRGSYIVVGRPNAAGRAFWKNKFEFDPESRELTAAKIRVNVPTALISVGTFESVVPTIVLERSTALTALLAANGADATIEQVNDATKRLAASIQAFTMGERLVRYRDGESATEILRKLRDASFKADAGTESIFFLLRNLNDCFQPSPRFTSVDEALAWRDKNPNAPCKKN